MSQRHQLERIFEIDRQIRAGLWWARGLKPSRDYTVATAEASLHQSA